MTVLNGLRKYTIILGLISRTPNILNGLAISTDKEKFFYNSKAESGKVVFIFRVVCISAGKYWKM